MNMEEHYDAYRNSAKRDMLDGYVEYVTKTKVGRGKKTIADMLRTCKTLVDTTIVSGNIEEYNGYLSDHRSVLMDAFGDMVKKAFDERVEKGQMRRIAILDIAHYNGWNWFKFLRGDIEITSDKMIIVPMHKESAIYDDMPVFDADEMRVVKECNIEHSNFDRVLSTKMKAQIDGRITKLVHMDDNQNISFHDTDTINKTTIRDWTGDIIYGKQAH